MATVRFLVVPSLARVVLVLGMMFCLLAGLAAVSAPSADAAVPASVGMRAVQAAASKRGTPYAYGAAGPTKFDCSGLTMWSFGKVGRRLPRTAAQQLAATAHVSAAQRQPGDLVFFMSGRSTYHVGIYAGRGMVWHAPKAGDRVREAPIWTSAVVYGRVR